MSSANEFDQLGALPSGTTVLEASAGTGKTEAISNLAIRFVAEQGIPIQDVLMVTFGTAATDELRSRVFGQLNNAKAALAGTTHPADSDSELLAHLCSADVPRRLARIEQALLDFDQATIATTHTFCALMLDRLGIVADWDGGERFTADLTELVTQVCDDLYTARFMSTTQPPFSLSTAREIAKASIEHQVPIHVGASPERESFAEAVRAEVARRKSLTRVYTYDDLILKMLDTLNEPTTRAAAKQRLAEQFPVVLVDEFQDTDPQQWAILDQAFTGASSMVLIGDPKQSIYAFRNADLSTYLTAVAAADNVLTLGTNYRSDPGICAAVGELFSGVAMGSPQVVVRPIRSHRNVDRVRIAGAAVTPVTIRRIPTPEKGQVQDSASLVRQDLVSRVRQLLSGATIHDKSGERPITPQDIAILTRQRDQAEALRHSLVAAGIPAVFPGAASIFESSAAADWAAILTAWLTPGAGTVRAAALTDLVGGSIVELIADPALATGSVATAIAESGILAKRMGFSAGWHALRARFDLDARLLSRTDGPALLSDLCHVAALCTLAQQNQRLDLTGLAGWLSDQRVNANSSDDAATARKLESDTAAVTLLTMHGAKGLQFPIVMLPTTTSWLGGADNRSFVFTENGRRSLFVGDRPGRSRPRAANRADQQAEELRLLYVAMTRAQSAVVTWWYNERDTPDSALHRLLARERGGLELKASYPAAANWEPMPPTLFSVQEVEATGQASDVPATPNSVPIVVREFNRQVDQAWRRTSYSALTADAHNDSVSPPAAVPPGAETDPALSQVVPLAEQPGGVAFGSLVHLVLEYLDWSKPDLVGAVTETLDRELPKHPLSGLDPETLAEGLVRALQTPLGPLAGGKSLSQLPTSRRLAELDFELPLGGTSKATVADLAAVLNAHLPTDDLLADYPQRLLDSPAANQVLSGFLTGSIDVVLEAEGRFLVIDYKTNKMPTLEDQLLTAGHYTPPVMAEAMMSSHYPLQALLYSVALHRYLKWRLPRYNPGTHLGGVGYLFVRGMVGKDAPVVAGWPTGVFGWQPSADLVLAASRVLGRGHA